MGYKLRGCAADHVEAGADQKRQHHRFAAKGDAPTTAGNAAAERRGLGRDDNVVAVGLGDRPSCHIIQIRNDRSVIVKSKMVDGNTDSKRVAARGAVGNNRGYNKKDRSCIR